MTDTTITLPIAIDFAPAPAKAMTRIAGWFSTMGSGFCALSEAYGRALGMAYCAPFQARSHGRKHGLDENLEGRDPNW